MDVHTYFPLGSPVTCCSLWGGALSFPSPSTERMENSSFWFGPTPIHSPLPQLYSCFKNSEYQNRHRLCLYKAELGQEPHPWKWLFPLPLKQLWDSESRETIWQDDGGGSSAKHSLLIDWLLWANLAMVSWASVWTFLSCLLPEGSQRSSGGVHRNSEALMSSTWN